MTTTASFYQQLNKNIPCLQQLASRLTKDFDTARFLYLETAHQAIKQSQSLDPDQLEGWMKLTMKKLYNTLKSGSNS